METTNVETTTPAAIGWLSGRRGLVIAMGVAAATAALAVGQHWLAIGDLLPLLFVLPCAVMMFKCMKGIDRGGYRSERYANSYRHAELTQPRPTPRSKT